MSWPVNFIDTLYPYLEILVGLINLTSIAVLLIGIVKVVIDLISAEKNRLTRKETAQTNNFIKAFFGSYILLSLEILIAADIMESILKPTLVDIARLGAIVVIRTLISYFLNEEVKETMDMKE